MTKIGFIVMVFVALGATALIRSPLVANEGAAGQGTKAGAGEFREGKYALRHGPDFEWLARELKLSQPQQEQLRALDRDLEQQANDIRQDNLLSGEDKERRIAGLKEGLGTRIKAILTSDQIQKFDQMGGLKAMMGRPHGVEALVLSGPNGVDRLGLTDAQKQAIEEIMKASKEQAAAAGGEVSKVGALKRATWERIMAVLTPEQQQKLAAAQRLEIENGPSGDNKMPELGTLGLPAEQRERLQAIIEQAAPRARAIQADPSLSEAAKQAQLTALYQEFRPRFLTVLTPSQEQKLRSLLLERPHERPVVPEGGATGEK